MELRPEVQAFAEAMETQLRKHDATRGRAGWKQDSPADLFDHYVEECKEFEAIMDWWRNLPAGSLVLRSDAERLREEAADVANMLMMVLDVIGLLPGTVAARERS